MTDAVRAWVEPAAHGDPLSERRTAYMRYIGQGQEIAVALPPHALPSEEILK